MVGTPGRTAPSATPPPSAPAPWRCRRPKICSPGKASEPWLQLFSLQIARLRTPAKATHAANGKEAPCRDFIEPVERYDCRNDNQPLRDDIDHTEWRAVGSKKHPRSTRSRALEMRRLRRQIHGRRRACVLRLPGSRRGRPRARCAGGIGAGSAVARLTTHSPLQTRVGIASGQVIVGDLIGRGASQEQAIVGKTPNSAARLHNLAAPNTVVIAESTAATARRPVRVSGLWPEGP